MTVWVAIAWLRIRFSDGPLKTEKFTFGQSSDHTSGPQFLKSNSAVWS
jgi:hypothetical protein